MRKIMTLLIAGIVLISGCQSSGVLNQKNSTLEVTESQQSPGTNEISESKETRDIFAMDTYMTLTGYGEEAKQGLDEAEAEIHRLDQLLSAQNKQGEIYAINQNGGGLVSEDTDFLLRTSLKVSEETKGSFDITVYPLVKAWGFISKDYKVLSREEIQAIMPKIGSSKIAYDDNTKTIRLNQGTEIDLGAIAKGYTAQRVIDIFRSHHMISGVISLGGNVQVLGKKPNQKPWKVAVRHPDSEGEYLGIVSAEDEAVVTSGGYERNFIRDGIVYHHLLDPKTGAPANNGIISATVVCKDGTMADALTTPLFVMGTEKAIQYWKDKGEEQKFEIILMTDDKKIYISEGLKDSFESDYTYEVISR